MRQTSSPTTDRSSRSSPVAELSKAQRRRETAELLEQVPSASPARREALQNRIIEINIGVAREVAGRYRGRGIPRDDLDQVAQLGLVKAVRCYDPGMATDLLTFAVPTIRGELRRHFRDQGWVVRPPRSIQELQAKLTAAEGELYQSLGREPRPAELAHVLGVDVRMVIRAQSANGCFLPTSLDDTGPDGDGGAVVDRLGAEESGYGGVEARALLKPLIGELSLRERRILELRFWQGWTQAEIGADIGVTQMQVSRLLQGVLARMRTRLAAQDPVAA